LEPPVGREWPAQAYEVGREKIREYAAAVGAASPVYRDPAAASAMGFRAVVAPPSFAAVYCAAAVASVMFDPLVGLFDPAAGLRSYRFVQRRQSYSWGEPVCAGDRITTTARLIDAGERDGRATRVFGSTSQNGDGAVVAEGEYEGVVPPRGGGARQRSDSGGEAPRPPRGRAPRQGLGAGELRPGDALPKLRTTPDRYAPMRYAGASGDFTPIHLDPAFARAFGLPGVILHGLYTYAQLCRCLLEPLGDDPRLLAKLNAAFKAPAFPERELDAHAEVVRVGDAGPELECRVLQEGRPVLQGSAVLAPLASK